MEEIKEYVFQMRISLKEIQKLAKDIFENFPEYGQYAFRCTHYDYENFIYIFEDTEDNKKYAVNLDTAVKGLVKFIEESLKDTIKLIPWDQLLDASNYDVDALDCVLQYAIFNELRYC